MVNQATFTLQVLMPNIQFVDYLQFFDDPYLMSVFIHLAKQLKVDVLTWKNLAGKGSTDGMLCNGGR